MEYGLIVTILCLTIVFGVLIMLMGALSLLRVFSRKQAPKNTEEEEEILSVEEEDSGVIAAITAAVSMMMQSESQEKKAKFVVRSIKRI